METVVAISVNVKRVLGFGQPNGCTHERPSVCSCIYCVRLQFGLGPRMLKNIFDRTKEDGHQVGYEHHICGSMD
jgi:hypothetical protein